MTRDTYIQIRVSEEEKAYLQERAREHGWSVSEYVRLMLVWAPIRREAERGPVSRLKFGAE